MTIPKDEQIRAALTWGSFKLKLAHGIEGDIPWTITRADVRAYVDEHGFPPGSVTTWDSANEGVYCHPLPDDDGYIVYFLERGARSDEQRFATKDEAIDHVLDTFYLNSLDLA